MKVINPKETIFYSIERTIKSYRQFAQRAITSEGIDITIDQLLVLRAIQDYEGISQTKISEMIFKDYASVTRIIDLLVKKEYLERSYHAEDRRRHQLTITKDGSGIIKKLNPIVANYRKKALINIPEEVIKNVKRVLDEISENCLGDKTRSNLKN